MAAWAVLGAGADGYDATRQPISRLAAVGAQTRPAMTAALLVLAAGMVLYGLALRPGTAWWLPVINGLATVAVAALPLGAGMDGAHGAAAAAGYVTLAGIPVILGRGRPLAVAVGAVAAAGLVASVALSRDGLFQRAGLTAAHVWVVVSALGLILGRSPTSSSTTPPDRAPAARRR